VFDKWSEALEHEKSINVKARHRGEGPRLLRTWVASDGTEFREELGETCARLNEARDYQYNLERVARWKSVAAEIWSGPIGSLDELEALLLKKSDVIHDLLASEFTIWA
jgi:hypothetical protein